LSFNYLNYDKFKLFINISTPLSPCSYHRPTNDRHFFMEFICNLSQ